MPFVPWKCPIRTEEAEADRNLAYRESNKARPASVRRMRYSPQHAKMTPLCFDRERAFVSAVGLKINIHPEGNDEQWNHGQDQGRYE
jgi:hypothetical protein